MWVPVVVRHVANCYTLFTFTLPLPKYHTAVLCPVWWLIGCNFVEPCPKCSHPRAYFRQHQIRSADEPMTIFFKCCNPECGHNWREWLECLLINCHLVVSVRNIVNCLTAEQIVSFTCKQLLYILHCVDMQFLPSCTICKASNIVSFLTFTKLALKSVLLVYFFVLFLVEIGFMHWKW